jgi:hypothetical protein
MRIAIIVLAIVVVAFVGLLVLVGNGATIPGLNPPPTKADGSVDEDALSDWHPPNIAAIIAAIGSSFAPHADFGTSKVTVDAGTSRLISAVNSKNSVDIAKLQLSGGALLITYVCKHKDDSSCSQTVCLCTPGSALTSPAVAFCKDDSQWKQSASTGVCSDRERREGTVLVYPEARGVLLTALGPSATAKLK